VFDEGGEFLDELGRDAPRERGCMSASYFSASYLACEAEGAAMRSRRGRNCVATVIAQPQLSRHLRGALAPKPSRLASRYRIASLPAQ
jgi:hypothetical protein